MQYITMRQPNTLVWQVNARTLKQKYTGFNIQNDMAYYKWMLVKNKMFCPSTFAYDDVAGEVLKCMYEIIITLDEMESK